MIWLTVGIAPFAIAGHLGLWLLVWNRIHGTALPKWIVSTISNFAKACTALLPLLVATAIWNTQATKTAVFLSTLYACTCVSLGMVSIPWAWVRRRSGKFTVIPQESSTILRNCHDAKQQSLEAADLRTRLLLKIPGNQSFELEQNEIALTIPRLSKKLNGLTIAHLTDLHFTGKVAKSYFDRAIDNINEMDADIIAITGDIIDENKYVSWIPATLGRLRAKHGVYAIFGNHDCRQDLSSLRLALAESGIQYLGGTVRELEIRGTRVLLAGNELPWIPPAPDMTDFPRPKDAEQLRVLLAHTPDELAWARHFDFDLMLAGHTHGGQIRIPGFGPFVCPSRLPLEYAEGIRYEAPTILSVSRGLSGQVPLRLNCRPEIICLELRHPQQLDSDEAFEINVLNEIETMRDEASKYVPSSDEEDVSVTRSFTDQSI